MLPVGSIIIPPKEVVPNFMGVYLTRRQQQAVYYLLNGLTNKDIAFQMGLSEGTVKVYMVTIFTKVGVRDRLELAVKYYQQRCSELERLLSSNPVRQAAA